MSAEDEETIPLATITIDGPSPGSGLAVTQNLPERVMVLPLRRAVPFPDLMMPVLLDSDRAQDTVRQAEAQNGYILLLCQKDPEQEEPGKGDFYSVGVLARVLKTLKLPDGNASAMCQGVCRAEVLSLNQRKKPLLVARIKQLVDLPIHDQRGRAMVQVLRSTLQRMVEVSEHYGDDFGTAVLNIEQPEQLADFCASYFVKDYELRQKLLEELDVSKRVERALELVTQELELAELGQRIQDEIRQKAEKAQKDYFLREQLKIIRRELGEEKDVRQEEIERFEKAIAESGLSEAAAARAQEELNRLRTTPPESGEYSVIRNYLDWLVTLPWSKSTADVHNLKQAAQVLDEDHYGLDDIKERILEFLAVRKLKPGHQGSILCFSGPPGVGKTSLGRSIARAMGREFWRFSLGGMRDEAEIKGHRRTYIGALPGRILQGIKACGSNNPVVMLDELDKLGSDFRGDPSSALLEVLDPEQNHEFLDHYLDVPFDLSRVMFLATANVLSQIPAPLRDRMEVIELPGYLEAEKVEIARRHLIPKQIDRHGLLKKHLSMSAAVLKKMVRLYTREAGVRGLEKQVRALCRKAAVAVAGRRKVPGRVRLEDLEKLLGPPRFPEDAERRVRMPGVIQGLAWTPHGGDVLFIEVAVTPGKGALQMTGSLGDVMSESCRIAMGYLKSQCEALGLPCDAFSAHDFHVHFPAGAIPKDGPSAGIAIASGIVSALTGKTVKQDVAMTGEISLLGEVLPVGGVREKVLAAQRLRLKRVILPAENQRDVKELKPELIKGLKFHYVEVFSQVYGLLFQGRGR